MAEGRKKDSETGTLSRLAELGEDALTRLMDELGKNPRVTDALGRAMGAKGKVDERTRKTLANVGLAAADELKDLRKQVERLEKRLAKLETGDASKASRRTQAGRKSTTSTKSSGGTARKSSSGSRSGTGSGSSSPS
jgi:polyhydroxyalkanoate synthesis regulator phasin